MGFDQLFLVSSQLFFQLLDDAFDGPEKVRPTGSRHKRRCSVHRGTDFDLGVTLVFEIDRGGYGGNTVVVATEFFEF